MSDRDTFGPWLRSERERRGISLDTLASVTKVNSDLWEGLERNDFSRWPSGIFARAFVRDYARAIGLDADDVVNEFCRLFPIGDRRSRGLINAQANLLGHKLSYTDSGGLPAQGERRSKPREDASNPTVRRLRLAPRTLAAILDTTSTLALSWLLAALFHLPFAACAAVLVLLYYAAATVVFGATPGSWFVAFLKPRVPSLFTVEERHSAHA
jgi:transcriptional regulator with XRE-family HTH domain